MDAGSLKKSLSLSLVLIAGIAIGLLWRSPPTAATASPAGASTNGDTNGDGMRDVSDAIYLLLWLFLEGPEPAPIAPDCPPRFRDNGDGTVSDRTTGLMWQQGTCDVDGDGMLDPDDMVTILRAPEIAAALDLAGHRDWRLPYSTELFGLIDVTHPELRATDPAFGPSPGFYWVSSTNGSDPCHGCPMGIDFESIVFQKIIEDDSTGGYVRAVRREVWPEE